MGVLKALEPAKVFHFFEEICGIPHGSYNTKAISDYLAAFARDRGLKYIQDEVNNVVIFGDASAGYEDAPAVMLQGHMDMVCEKEAGCAIDMAKEGIRLLVDGDWVTADGTTLGGDNGIAVAMMLALLDSGEYAHPKLECVFTVDEETGLEGAEALDVSCLEAKQMINLDSEDEGVITVSCAGGITANCGIPVRRERVSGKGCKVRLDGLQGGHSGIEIHKERANANILMGRVLSELGEAADIRIRALAGGNADNVICNACTAEIVALDGVKALTETADRLQETLSAEYRAADPALRLTVEEEGGYEGEALDEESTARIVGFLLNAPNGVVNMSMDIAGLTETSLNLGAMKLSEKEAGEEELELLYSIRSSVKSRQDFVCRRLDSFCRAFQGKAEFSLYYPGWEYRADSPLREICISVYREQSGKEPTVEAIHAGLECGFFAGKMGADLDAVSIGPTMEGVHTPSERLSISSTERTWNYLLGVLKACR